MLTDVHARNQMNKIRRLNSSGLQNVVLYNILRVPQAFHTSDNPMNAEELRDRLGRPDGCPQSGAVHCAQGTVSSIGAINILNKSPKKVSL